MSPIYPEQHETAFNWRTAMVSDFLKKLSSIGRTSRPTGSTGRNKSVGEAFIAALEKQIGFVKQEIDKPKSIDFNRGHWVKPEKNGTFTVQFGASPIEVVEKKKYFVVSDLKEALALLEGGKELVEEKSFIAKLEEKRSKRSGPRASKK
ncbi:hypothetical protein ACTOV4_02700 [Brucella sp. C7-11G]